MSPRPHLPAVISASTVSSTSTCTSTSSPVRPSRALSAFAFHLPAFASDVSASPAPVPHVPSVSALVSTLRQ
ncbi:hypothetical protein CKAH01_17223 [Colletotrichum kahawae]|uniref:Uncharacterized protein n=1 Tax=Colletotrichum kahawae TaxID=34407 RepID=A0AAE0D5H2_COLKA|nr:hypothetical protein CKAH01_17223 [Colletotrichum kahawae]